MTQSLCLRHGDEIRMNDKLIRRSWNDMLKNTEYFFSGIFNENTLMHALPRWLENALRRLFTSKQDYFKVALTLSSGLHITLLWHSTMRIHLLLLEMTVLPKSQGGPRTHSQINQEKGRVNLENRFPFISSPVQTAEMLSEKHGLKNEEFAGLKLDKARVILRYGRCKVRWHSPWQAAFEWHVACVSVRATLARDSSLQWSCVSWDARLFSWERERSRKWWWLRALWTGSRWSPRRTLVCGLAKASSRCRSCCHQPSHSPRKSARSFLLTRFLHNVTFVWNSPKHRDLLHTCTLLHYQIPFAEKFRLIFKNSSSLRFISANANRKSNCYACLFFVPKAHCTSH